MTLEEQRDYWEERYNIENNRNRKLAKELEIILKDMRKNGDNYWGDKLENIIKNNN